MSDMPNVAQRFGVDDCTAVVTGASSGIGRHMATVLAESGAKVVALARREGALNDLCSQVLSRSPQARIHSVSADLLNVSDFDELASKLSEPFGAPNCVINAAGVNYREPMDEISLQSWNQTLNLNLSVPFFLSRALVNGMGDNGSIINIASLQSARAFANSAPYGASKGGVAQLTRAMAEAWGAQGIRANAIAPGFFPTELTKAVFDDADKASANAAQTCLGRNGELDDLAGPLLFLCSQASAYVSGQVLYVDGGFTAR